ncbi:membrane-bound lytic murein transglycosylase E, partial [Trabulsiella guamensis ATCC 49490]
NAEAPVKRAMQWMPISEKAGAAWGVSPRLITAIIAVESGGNPELVSKSNAVGLMQLKASTAGREVYRYMGWKGQPSTSELKNPERNISMGTAYLSILEHGVLAGIKDPEVMQYALVVSYVNGAGALLRTFSSDRKEAIEEINDLDADEFFEHVVKKHPAPQAPRYIWKVQQAMDAM